MSKDYFSAALSPNTLNDQQRTVDCIWYTGVDVPRNGWDGPYIPASILRARTCRS